MQKNILFISTFFCLLLSQVVCAQQWSNINMNNIWNLNSGNVGIGKTNPLSKLDVLGEIRSSLTGVSNLRLICGGYATLFRNDGRYTHFLLTNKNDINGSWNNLRPLVIDNETGDISIANRKFFVRHNSGMTGIGTDNPVSELDVLGEIRSTLKGGVANVRLVGGNYALMLRNDGNDFHFLLTNKSDINGIWNQLRPFRINNQTGDVFLGNENLFISPTTGFVGIGYTTPTAKLDVNGDIRATEVKVCLNQGCDYVFEENYNLMPIQELKNFIDVNKHLPEVAPAKIMERDGINLSEMNALLLKKIEELTLYIIQQQEDIEELKKQLN